MGPARRSIRWRSTPRRLALFAGAAVLAGGFSALSALRVPVAWSVVVAALVGVTGLVLLPLLLERVKAGGGGERLLAAETELWCPASAVTDPLRLGVHAALAETDGGRAGTRLPQYVGRDADPELAAALRRERLVVVLGDAAAGKSRTAYEAVRRDLADHWIMVPRGVSSLLRLANAGIVLRRTVVWLDDLERYLGVDGVTVELVERLTGAPGNQVVVLATMRTGAYDELIPDGAVGTGRAGELRAARSLLDSAQLIRLRRDELSPAERRRAVAAARDDPRIGLALNAAADGIGLAEFLAAAPKLWDRWRDGRASDVAPVGAAIVAAAVDCRRAGLVRPVDEQVLRDLCAGYLGPPSAVPVTPEAFAAGLAWATAPVRATSALLARRDGGYRVFDYLVDRVQRERRPPPIPDATWQRLLREVTADDAWGIGVTAFYQGHPSIAETAFRAGTSARDPAAAAVAQHGLGLVRWQQGALAEAEECLRQAYAGGPLPVVSRAAIANSLGCLLRVRGAVAESQRWLREAADAGYVPALVNLGWWYQEQGESAAAEQLAGRAAATGSIDGALMLGELCEARGDTAGAERSYRAAAARGSTRATTRLGCLLAARGDRAGAGDLWRAAAAAGDPDAAARLGTLLAEQGDLTGAKKWYARAAHRGDAQAAYSLAQLLLDEGDDRLAEWHLRESAAAGGLVAAHELAVMLVGRGELAEAADWLRRVAEAPAEEMAAHQAELEVPQTVAFGGDLRLLATVNLGHVAYRRDDLEQARRWFEQAAAGGNADAVAVLQRFRAAASDHEGRDGLIRRAAEQGDPAAVFASATALVTRGELGPGRGTTAASTTSGSCAGTPGSWTRRSAGTGAPPRPATPTPSTISAPCCSSRAGWRKPRIGCGASPTPVITMHRTASASCSLRWAGRRRPKAGTAGRPTRAIRWPPRTSGASLPRAELPGSRAGSVVRFVFGMGRGWPGCGRPRPSRRRGQLGVDLEEPSPAKAGSCGSSGISAVVPLGLAGQVRSG